MKPLIEKLLYALLNDEVAVRRWLRAGLMAVAGSGFGFANEIATVINAPEMVQKIKMAAIFCGFISVAINLGDKNPPAEDKPK